MVARVARNILPATHSEALARLSLSAYTEWDYLVSCNVVQRASGDHKRKRELHENEQ